MTCDLLRMLMELMNEKYYYENKEVIDENVREYQSNR